MVLRALADLTIPDYAREAAAWLYSDAAIGLLDALGIGVDEGTIGGLIEDVLDGRLTVRGTQNQPKRREVD